MGRKQIFCPLIIFNQRFFMSRQIQLRQRTANEHNDFTGAIGEVTMDTDNKTDVRRFV